MTLYEYLCTTCHITFTTSVRATFETCPTCQHPAHRRFGFNIRSSMPEHFNHTTGQYVTNTQSFTTQLKRLSEQQTLSTGIEHTYQPVTDPSTKSSLGVTTAGLYEQARAHHDKAISPDDNRRIIIP